ncbi:MAG: hypothetical protein RL095_2822 [Verrucomicrobiota bacterium]|jgi:UDP-N-acetylmuramate dehydrogenase
MNALAHDVALDACNTLGLPSRASHFARIATTAGLGHSIAAWRQENELASKPWRILGGGSNLVLPRRIEALVLKIEIPGREILSSGDEGVFVRGGGGENWHDFVQWTLAQGLCGLENLSLIPGTVGASPIQNIGAYGVEVMDLIHEVHAVDLLSGEPRIFPRQDCRFSYRDSIFKHEWAERLLITEVIFHLPRVFRPNIGYGDIARQLESAKISCPGPAEVAAAVMAIRRSKLPDPARIGNAGSFFKNPVLPAEFAMELKSRFPALVSYPQSDGTTKLAAGWLIEQAGWKGRRIGPAGMFEKQALCLVNHGGATAEDIIAVRDAVAADVLARFGVQLEAEPVHW